MDTYINNLKNAILSLCKERDISVNKLASLTGITQSTLGSIMNGESLNPKLATLIKLADFFEIPLDQLVGRERYFQILLNDASGEEAAALELGAI